MISFREWTRERVASADVTIPYRPRAAKFYRENGVSKPEMDQTQQRLLSLNPQAPGVAGGLSHPCRPASFSY